MGSVVAMILILCVVYVVVLGGTVAYQLTGLDWRTAQFQALSAFTMTGFTTRVAERVVSHPLRRRITMVLIVSGYATTASVIATLVTSVSNRTPLSSALTILGLVAVSAIFLNVARKANVQLALASPIRRLLTARMAHESVPHEELLEYRKGFGITRIEVPRDSRLAGLTLRQADLRSYKLQVLAIESHGVVEPVPTAEHLIEVGDHLVLYGEIAGVQAAFAPALVKQPKSMPSHAARAE